MLLTAIFKPVSLRIMKVIEGRVIACIVCSKSVAFVMSSWVFASGERAPAQSHAGEGGSGLWGGAGDFELERYRLQHVYHSKAIWELKTAMPSVLLSWLECRL